MFRFWKWMVCGLYMVLELWEFIAMVVVHGGESGRLKGCLDHWIQGSSPLLPPFQSDLEVRIYENGQKKRQNGLYEHENERAIRSHTIGGFDMEGKSRAQIDLSRVGYDWMVVIEDEGASQGLEDSSLPYK
ncbi:hypothetical protein Tco_0090003 [Tanacetum coccineum]